MIRRAFAQYIKGHVNQVFWSDLGAQIAKYDVWNQDITSPKLLEVWDFLVDMLQFGPLRQLYIVFF